MSLLPAAALELFEAHHGVASHGQLTDLGVSPSLIKRLRRDGLFVDVLKGAYYLRGQPLTFAGRCVAVCVAHPEVAIAGPAAGRIWGFRRLEPTLKVNVLARPGGQPTTAPWVLAYRTDAIDRQRDFIDQPDGIAVTSRARTVLDLSRWLDDTDLRSVMEQAVRDGGLTTADLVEVAIDWVSPRRPWLARFLGLTQSRLDGGPADSHPEVLLGEALRDAGVAGLVRQHPVDLPGYGRARFDLAVPTLKWAIEVDVFPTHAETAGAQRDACRDAAAASVGWVTTRLGPERFGRRLTATVADLVAVHAVVVAGARQAEQ